MRDRNGWMLAAIMAAVGYLLPSLVLGRLIKNRMLRIENGLPDALDLMIVCIEAGSSLDQAHREDERRAADLAPGSRRGAAA